MKLHPLAIARKCIDLRMRASSFAPTPSVLLDLYITAFDVTCRRLATYITALQSSLPVPIPS